MNGLLSLLLPADVIMFQVSIDGAVPATHDHFRGKGNFFKAIEGIKSLQKK